MAAILAIVAMTAMVATTNTMTMAAVL